MIKRKALLIYYNDKNIISNLEQNGINIYYNSVKNNYALIYFDFDKTTQIMDLLKRSKNITSIEESLFDVEKITF